MKEALLPAICISGGCYIGYLQAEGKFPKEIFPKLDKYEFLLIILLYLIFV